MFLWEFANEVVFIYDTDLVDIGFTERNSSWFTVVSERYLYSSSTYCLSPGLPVQQFLVYGFRRLTQSATSGKGQSSSTNLSSLEKETVNQKLTPENIFQEFVKVIYSIEYVLKQKVNE